MTEVIDGEATPAQVASFITAMRMKGETVEEIVGCVKVMRDKAVKVRPKSNTLLDTCGTGGDRLDTFNISTTATFVIVGAGVTVAKHGNRAASSTCGSADVLEALGANLNLDAERVATCIDTAGMGFMFPRDAPGDEARTRSPKGNRDTHRLQHSRPDDQPRGSKTADHRVFSPDLTETMAQVLGALGTERAIISHGMAGLDELSTLGETRMQRLRSGVVSTYTLIPEDVGLGRAACEDLSAGTGRDCRQRSCAADVLDGE